jgi:hypothetical protein
MEKTFTYAGVSTLNGVVAYRFANGADRAKVLEKNGHTDIKLFELDTAMTKEAAILWLNAKDIHAEANRVTARAASPAKVTVQSTKGHAVTAPVDAVADDDDGFVEPKSESVQVAMCRLAREFPELTAPELLARVTKMGAGK